MISSTSCIRKYLTQLGIGNNKQYSDIKNKE